MGYLTNFIVYTFAMVGIIVFALLVFKNSSGCGGKRHSKFLKVIDSISLGPRKSLYIVSAGEEKFLIAGDSERTSLISKLKPKGAIEENIPEASMPEEPDFTAIPAQSFRETMNNLPKQKKYIDRSILGIKKTNNSPYNSVMKNLAVKMSSESYAENKNFVVNIPGGD